MVRFKTRYLLVEAQPIDPKSLALLEYQPNSCPRLTSSTLANQLRTTLSANFGQLGSALSSQALSVKYCNATTGTFIVRTAREQLTMVWASITLMTGMPDGGGGAGDKWIWRVTRVGGTICSVQKAAIRQATRRVEAMLRHSKSEGERREIAEMLAKCRSAIGAIEA